MTDEFDFVLWRDQSGPVGETLRQTILSGTEEIMLATRPAVFDLSGDILPRW